MKKIIYSVAAMALAFFSVSCQQENLEPVGGNTVTYTVQVPGAIATKSADDFVLTYEVYRVEEVGKVDEPAARPIYEGTTGFHNDKAELSLEFVKDQNFVVLFWAQKEGAPYNIGDLRKVSLTALTANDVNAEVFSGIDNVNNCKSVKGGVVELVRPIAQLNIATLEDGLTIGNTTTHTIIPQTFDMTVNGLWTSYNVATGDVKGSAGNITFAGSPVSGGEFKTDYVLMGANYIGFIPQDGSNVTVNFNIHTKEDGTINHIVSNVPVRPNYRTNILGNLVSASDKYIVTLDEEWGDAGKDMEVLADGIVKNINGDYEVSKPAGLAYAINNLFVDANGVANTATFYVEPGLYDMAQHALNDITVKSGTLKIYDTEAVVTRSGEERVVIKGLKKALIDEVKDGATVFFSGITITDFNGADAAALVQTNEGKVVLADCDIVNEQGENTELVGGNAPVEVEKGEEEAGDLIYTAAQLAAAFADESVKSIALGADITIENTLVFPEGRTATLDLRGWELTVNEPASNYAINNHGTLTIKDSYATGEVNARGIYNGYVAEGDPITEARLTIKSGTFNAMGENGGAAIFNYGIAEIKGGKFTGYTALNNQPGGKMTIVAADITERTSVYAVQNNGGEIIINGINLTQGIGNYNGTLTVNGGQIHTTREGSSHAIYVGGGEINVYGGDFMSNGNGVVNSNDYIANIYGGTFTKDPNGKTSYLMEGAKMTINGGTFNAHASNPAGHPVRPDVTVKGGTFNYKHTSIAEGYTIVDNANGTWTVIEAKAAIGKTGYATFQAAIDAVKNDETVTLLAECNEDVTFTQTADKSFVLDGNGQTMTGTIKIIARAGTDAPVKLDIKNFNFTTTDSDRVFISSVETNYYPRNLTVSGCTFEGPTAGCDVVPVSIKSGSGIIMENCTADKVHSLFQNAGGGWDYTIKSCEVTNAGRGINLHSVQGALVENVKIHASNKQYGIRVDAAYEVTTTIKDCEIHAFIPVIARKASANYTFVFDGTNTMSPANTDGLWCAIGTSEYETNGTMPTPATGKVTVDLRDTNLKQSGVYGATWPPVAKVGSTEYGSIDEAIANWTNNSTLTLLADVILSDVVTLKSTEHHILNLGTYTMNAASGKNAFVIQACGMADRAERPTFTIEADASNPGGINAGNKCIVYYKYADGGISTYDRPIIYIKGGVFNASTSSFGTAGIYTIGSDSDKCATLNISGGTFNCTINGSTKSKLLISGGVFNYSVGSQGDSTALRLIWGGKFKTLGFMTADDKNTKFWIGTKMATSDVGVYVDKDNYLVVGGPVITEAPGANYEKKSYSSWNSYLKYSSAATYGLYYEK